MERIVYFYRDLTEFIRIDLDLLREHYEVVAIECRSRWPRPLLLLKLIARADLAAAWFASWHSFVPALLCRLLGKPCVISVGGYDSACEPDIGYGHQRGGLRRIVALATMRLATRLIVVSEASRREVLDLGLPAGKVTLCFLGLDPARYPVARLPRKDIVVTVGGVDRDNLARKGLEAFVLAAALCARAQFVVVGPWKDHSIDRLRAIAPPNVHFTGRVSHEDKVAWLSRARVVAQVSRHEAFGLSLAEGMLCGAVPVATRAGSLPEVVGGCGVLVDSQHPAAIAEGVRRALALGPEAGVRARSRVLQHFALEHRRRALAAVISSELARSRRFTPARGLAPAPQPSRPNPQTLAPPERRSTMAPPST